MWTDIKEFPDGSFRIHNKIPKTRKTHGEYISLFPFPEHSCCPVAALSCLKNFARTNNSLNKPVFTFENGKFLTLSTMNECITHFLTPNLGTNALDYSCKSFRAALPSALASLNIQGSDVSIKRFGRWDSKAFEKYTRLDHKAKEKIFRKFTLALRDQVHRS